MDFPCSVHKDDYDNCKIAVDEKELKELHTDGWLTSAEWYEKVLGITSEPSENAPKTRGRKPKSDF